MRKLITGKTSEADITYDLPFYEDQLTSKDKAKLFKLLERIQEGKSIGEKISQSFHDTRKIPLILIVDTHERRRDIFTLLHYARFCKNKQAENDLLEEAKKHGLFEEFNCRKIVSNYLGSHGKPISTYSTVKDGVVKVEGFEPWDDKEVMNPNMKSEEDGKNSSIENIMEESVCNISEDIEEVSDGCKENFYAEQQKEITDTIEGGIQPCEKINNGEDYERNEENQGNFANSGRTVVKELNALRIFSSNTCVNDKSFKIADEETSTKTMQQRAILVGVVGVVLLVSGIVSHIMKAHTIGAVGVIAGLACMGFVLYSTLEPSTKLEKVEELFQSNAREHS
ncbi:hypothetical protein [Wolbachia endosymbiont (group A) of Paraperithous gnathaulax]|uniref:hypothetical protein n=1 Tax=Wolbachia endosymbiont (group A) of Paraperithous gnathaulax TaxID=3066212 RepID=UPI00333EA95B